MNEEKKKYLSNLIDIVILGLRSRIIFVYSDSDSIYDLNHLNFIISQIEKLKIFLESERFDLLKGFEINIGRIVVDTWPLDDVLGNQICEIEYLCEKWNLV